jgi:mono/diheme cytochrome c family protein
MPPRVQALAAMIVATLLALCLGARARPPQGGAPTPTGPASRRFTREELHRNGGVPQGWKFTLPEGEAERGRRVFADLECHKCHAVAGESFPPAGVDPQDAGPELTGMGPYHPAEYFAESVLSPNAVIVKGRGYAGPDGRSIMPAYADSLSVTQLVDLVAYLRSLRAGGVHGGAGHCHDASP